MGPVSQQLAAEVAAEVRRQGLVIWLDKDGAYTSFVDALADDSLATAADHPVVRFRKSFLEVLLALEHHGSGLDKQPLLIHLPGFNEETIRQTPLLEMYTRGVRYRKALDTLIRDAAMGRVTPPEVERFVAGHPTLQEADLWLQGAAQRDAAGLEGLLAASGGALLVQGLASKDSPLHVSVTSAEDMAIFKTYLHKLTGLDEQWMRAFLPRRRSGAGGADSVDDLLAALGAWLLCVEYVHDLRRPPRHPSLQRLKGLAKPLVNTTRELLDQLRSQHGDAYAKKAHEVEAFLAAELEQMTADDFGPVDTFRKEGDRVLSSAIAALQAGDWTTAQRLADARQGERSFWLQRERQRRWAWRLVAEAASFGRTLSEHAAPFEGAGSIEDAVEIYASSAYLVDLAHRRFEQQRLTLCESRMPEYGPLQEVATSLRHLHRTWADELAVTFTRLCVDQGFLPTRSLRQRTLYEEVVHPLTLSGDKVAFFMINAFRYELATELATELETTGNVVTLKPRLAELPTITSVGMNVLAPVAKGDKLVVAGTLGGFKTGEFTVSDPKTRALAIAARSVGKPALLMKLTEVCEATAVTLTSKLSHHQLLIVHAKDSDDGDEASIDLHTFESLLRRIRAAAHRLQSTGVKHFVFTANHGFLVQDETTATRRDNNKTATGHRHILGDGPRQNKGMAAVSLLSLGYEGIEGYLLFCEDTAVFSTATPSADIVHGGNSPQERIIPVLTVTRQHATGASIAEYLIEATPDSDVANLHRVRIRVGFAKHTTTGLGFATAQSIDVGLVAVGAPHVRVVIKDVSGAGSLHTGRVRLPIGKEWTEVVFAIEGPRDERIKIKVLHADNIDHVQPVTLDSWFSVRGCASVTPAAPVETAPIAWADAIEDEAVRRVFVHIEEHGAITEPAVTNFLGSPRAFRRFSLSFDDYVTKLPFAVSIEPSDDGKRYVKEGEK